ncbi:uncharacterized protein BKA78DRAFT_320646 [Phyllosticta capitalensis]|uniref:uncharacterized protein n=1 Tax=Phyllosticta capitalensis TaxID=121624 RepID=UPI00312FB748
MLLAFLLASMLTCVRAAGRLTTCFVGCCLLAFRSCLLWSVASLIRFAPLPLPSYSLDRQPVRRAVLACFLCTCRSRAPQQQPCHRSL